jgi:hypothetical protein
MRLLCIALAVGVIIWFLPTSSPLLLTGFFMVSGVMGARLSEQIKIPGSVGMLAAGFLIGLGPTSIVQTYQAIAPLADIAMAWTGLVLGAALSPTILKNRRLILGSTLLFLSPALITFGVLIAFDISLQMSLQCALIMSMTAGVLSPESANPIRDTLPLSLVVSAMGFIFLGLSVVPAYQSAITAHIPDLAKNLIVWIIGVEIAFRCLQYLRTDTGRFLCWLVFTSLIAITSWYWQIHPLFIAWPTGLAISLRSRHGVRSRTGLPHAEPLIAFALAYYACGLGQTIETNLPTYVLPLIISMVIGKLVGGILANRITSQPIQACLPLLPQGLLGVVCFEHIIPGNAAAAFLLATVLALPIPILAINGVIEKIKNGRLREKLSDRQAV